MTPKLAAAHHTLADWDFMHGATYRSLASDYYISPPTSLKYSGAPVSWSTAVLCRIPGTLCLPQGEVRTWCRYTSWFVKPCMFRNQAPLGTSNWQNCYYIALGRDVATLVRVVGGGFSNPDDTPYPGYRNEWRHHRIFWYNGKTPAEQPALCVDIYAEVDGDWVKQCSTLYDTLNQWKDSAINRCGFICDLYGGMLLHFDDTEIWGPV